MSKHMNREEGTLCRRIGYSPEFIYQGLSVKECRRENYGNKYFTIINPRTGSHVHTKTKKGAITICNCFKKIETIGTGINFALSTRNKACKLFGYDVKF